MSITIHEPVDIQDATPKRQPIKKGETPEQIESDSVPKAKPKRKLRISKMDFLHLLNILMI